MKAKSQLMKWSSVLSLTATLLLASFAASQSYSVTDLGSLDAGGVVDVSFAYGINRFGHVAGSSYTALALHAFLWTKPQGMQDLGTLGGSTSIAYAINDSGTVVGQADLANGDVHAFSWTQSGGMQDLGTLGGHESAAFAINDAGEIVGESYPANGVAPHAFLWCKQHGMRDLGTLGGATSQARGINNLGEVVGDSATTGGVHTHAFLWTASKGMQDLGTVKSWDPSYANGINNLGQVVGYAGLTQLYTYTYGLLWTQNQVMKTVGFLESGTQSFGFGINLAGQAVGSFNNAGGFSYAFVWTGSTGMQDLNQLIPANSGWILGPATAINLVGQIVGSGPVLINGNYTNHAFLLTAEN
jgi:probable HAF family extracellular repeat protein